MTKNKTKDVLSYLLAGILAVTLVSSVVFTGTNVLASQKALIQKEIGSVIDEQVAHYLSTKEALLEKKPLDEPSVTKPVDEVKPDTPDEVVGNDKITTPDDTTELPTDSEEDTGVKDTPDAPDKEVPVDETPVDSQEKPATDTTDREPATEVVDSQDNSYFYTEKGVKIPFSKKTLEAVSIDISRLSHKDGKWTYKIARGDTLSKLSAAFGYSVDSLAKHNHIKDVNLIYANTSLRIPNN